MEPKDYSRIMRMPEGERKEFLNEEKSRVFAEGAEAGSVLSYLAEYFDKKSLANFIKFSTLSGEATIDEFRTLWHSQNSLQELYNELKGKIEKANRKMNEVPRKESNVNI